MSQDEYDEMSRINSIPDEKERDKLIREFLALGEPGRELLFRMRKKRLITRGE